MKTKKRSGIDGTHYDGILDLHGMSKLEADEAVCIFLKRHPHSSLLILHGDGTGALRERIRKQLESGTLPNRCFFAGEDIGAPGGYGVTAVFT